MPSETDYEQEVKLIIMELMLVLHKHGIHQIHMGGLMRLIGVDEETAHENDDDYVVLDKKFVKYIQEAVNLADTPITNDQTIH